MSRQLSSEETQELIRVVNSSRTRKEAATKLGVSVPTLYNWIRGLNGIKKVTRGRPRRSASVQVTSPKDKPYVDYPKIEQGLWEAYKANKSDENRNALAENYRHWVKYIITNRLKNIPDNADILSCIQAGQMAVLDLIPKYDGSVKFTSYAARRVIGAALDEMRASDHVPRLTRTREKKRKTLEQQGQNAEEIMGTKAFEDSLTKGVESIDKTVYETDNSKTTSVKDLIESAPIDQSEFEKTETFRHICRGCTIEQQTILYLYYYKEKSMREIGKILDLSENRISQMHSQILNRLVHRGIEAMV
jgi:RNA polymerase sigma factor for flagellar operon FliA